MADKPIPTINSPLPESEQGEIIHDLEKVGLSLEQIQDAMSPTNTSENPLIKYENVYFEDIILSYSAHRNVEWPLLGHCGHKHTTKENASSCARRLGPEWQVVKNVAGGFGGLMLDTLLQLEKRILEMKAQPFGKRKEPLTDEQLERLLKRNKKDVRLAKTMCTTFAIAFDELLPSPATSEQR